MKPCVRFVMLFTLGAMLLASSYGGLGETSKAPTDIEQLSRHANEGDVEAQFTLALMYDQGNGIPKDKAKAAEFYQKAAIQGHKEAANSLGLIYESGIGVLRDYEVALKWFHVGAAKGNEQAAKNRDRLEAKIDTEVALAAHKAAKLLGCEAFFAEWPESGRDRWPQPA